MFSRFGLAVLAALMALGGVPTVAAANDREECERQSGEPGIAACSRAIASGGYAGHELAVLTAIRGDRRASTGDLSRALADYDEAIRLDPRYPHAYNYRGMVYAFRGDADRAFADYDEAIRLAPRYAHAYLNRGNAWLAKGDPDAAIADFDEAIRLEPRSAAAHIDRGDAWLRKGDSGRALADFDEAIRLEPKDAMAYNNRGRIYFQRGETDRALADYDEALRLAPRFAMAYNNRSEAWSRKGDFARTIADFDAASRLIPESPACRPEAGRVIDCIKPSVTDPAIQRFDSPHYVLSDDKSGPEAKLLVFLSGTDGRPPGPLGFLRAAADAGYRVISLVANDVPAVAQYCPQKPDPDCSEKFRRMRIYGDGTVLDPAIDNTPAESIVNRLVKLLQYLDRKEPQRGWGAYLENGAPKWSRIALAGQSQGAGMAAYIAQGHEVARVILFSSPWDYLQTGPHTERLAPWLSAPSKTPPQRWYAGYHENEDTAALIARAYAALRIPPDHIRVFKVDLPVSPQVARRDNLYHLQGISSPAYDRDRAFFLD